MKRSGEFWLDDDTVILVTRDVEFMVYSGVLATHSRVFWELFSQDNPIRIVPINGKNGVPCPVVTLTDSPEDLRHILRVYVPRRNVSVLVAGDPSFAMISAYIRLGKKYKMTSLYEQSLDFLKIYYPTTLEVWLEAPEWDPRGWLSTQLLARLTRELALLPAAFISSTTLNSIARGFTREDGLQETLAPDDLNICFRTKTALRKASIKVLLDTLSPVVAPTCETAAACRKAFRGVLAELRFLVDDLIDQDPFSSYARHLEDGGLEFEVCAACLSMTDTRCQNGGQELWNSLPEVLGIKVPGWGEQIAAAAG
ncbi:hypothetical protein K466DRAFT_494420 [Polyporus arcularius HHB13444]|uniref:BTB domain-containing protein n=1 Tax=Polyporus arcularius HHB13444 TaxID=1314778 RepID=A0A5C3P7X4_9APHY|nr:hypothetical protein K466DRAFT_494420 [Polyporus arcularius HHB13444]